jgi:hypothetical protein
MPDVYRGSEGRNKMCIIGDTNWKESNVATNRLITKKDLLDLIKYLKKETTEGKIERIPSYDWVKENDRLRRSATSEWYDATAVLPDHDNQVLVLHQVDEGYGTAPHWKTKEVELAIARWDGERWMSSSRPIQNVVKWAEIKEI